MAQANTIVEQILTEKNLYLLAEEIAPSVLFWICDFDTPTACCCSDSVVVVVVIDDDDDSLASFTAKDGFDLSLWLTTCSPLK